MYIRCAKCQQKLPQQENRSGLLLLVAGASAAVAAGSYGLHLASPIVPLASALLALGSATATYSKSCRTFSLNAAGPGSWGVECPHCQHLNFWKAS